MTGKVSPCLGIILRSK